MRIPWVSVALLIVLGLLAAMTFVAWGPASPNAVQNFEIAYAVIGWAGVGSSLIVGALGVWARAPATLATALAIIGAGGFMGMWLTQFVETGDDSGLHLAMVLAFGAVLVSLATSARRPVQTVIETT